MTFESSARGRPHVKPAVDSDPTATIHHVLDRMHDSVVGLRKAAGLVSDDALTRYLAGMTKRREEALQTATAAAADAGIEPVGDRPGTAVESLRRGWMRLEASLDGDEQIVGTVIDQEESMLEEVEDALTVDLPTAVGRLLRKIAGELGSDITGLSEWQRAEEGGR